MCLFPQRERCQAMPGRRRSRKSVKHKNRGLCLIVFAGSFCLNYQRTEHEQDTIMGVCLIEFSGVLMSNLWFVRVARFHLFSLR